MARRWEAAQDWSAGLVAGRSIGKMNSGFLVRQGGAAVTAGDEAWVTDPATLREVVLDREALTSRLNSCPAVERVWILTLLERFEEAVAEGEALLAAASNRFHPLLVLARAYQGQYRWQEAALLQEEALRLARTPAREATARFQIGRRLFEEARYRDSAAEFEWAADLYRTAGRTGSLIQRAEQAQVTARELASRPFDENHTHSAAETSFR